MSRKLREKNAIVLGLTNDLANHDGERTIFAPLENLGLLTKTLKYFQPNYIIHLGGVSFANHDDALLYYRVNVVGTDNLLRACFDQCPDIRKIILASSAAIYGDPKLDNILESQPPCPLNHYGISKLSMEYLALTYSNKLPILITRPFNYTGPGQDSKFLIPKIVAHFRREDPVIELGNTAIIREFSDVRDIVENYVALLRRKETGFVNMCSGNSNSFADIISILRDISGHVITVKINPKFVRDNDLKRLVGDATKLRRLTNYTPKYSLKKTLTDMLNA